MTRKRRLRLILILAGLLLFFYGLFVSIVSFERTGLELIYRLITGIFITLVGIGLAYLGSKIKESRK
jgi:hypothetical protein